MSSILIFDISVLAPGMFFCEKIGKQGNHGHASMFAENDYMPFIWTTGMCTHSLIKINGWLKFFQARCGGTDSENITICTYSGFMVDPVTDNVL